MAAASGRAALAPTGPKPATIKAQAKGFGAGCRLNYGLNAFHALPTALNVKLGRRTNAPPHPLARGFAAIFRNIAMTDPSSGDAPAAPSKRGWLAQLPDTRAFLALGFFGLTAYVLHLLATQPGLGENKLFFALAEGVVVTGLIGGVVAFYFAASKSGGGA